MRCLGLLAVLLSVLSVRSEVYFEEQFLDGDAWRDRWVESKHREDLGEWTVTAGSRFYGDAEKDKGLQTSQDARFYAISARFQPFSNRGRSVVVQFTVKHEQKMDCGGGYVKVFPAELDQESMHGESQYFLMFGPDICGFKHKKVHVIFYYNGQNHLIKKDIKAKDDELTHLYTLILHTGEEPMTYEVRIDNEKVESGELEDDWDFLPPRKIQDPEVSKPEDWDDREKIDDPDDEKPEDWDQPENIPHPTAPKPSDWDEDMDGDWEPPMVPNPDYKGEWFPAQIDNPAYKGEWIHPLLDNPEYTADPELCKFDNIGVLGLDLWQVKSGTIFDNFLITDDVEEAEAFGKKTWGVTKGPETKMHEKYTDLKRKEEAEQARREAEEEEAAAAAAAEEGGEDEEEDDDDEEEEEDGDDEGSEEDGSQEKMKDEL